MATASPAGSTSEPALRVIEVAGNHLVMGYQHGRQVADLRPAILSRIAASYTRLREDGVDASFAALVDRTAGAVAARSPATLELLQGLSAGLDLPYEALLHYNLAIFLRDALATRRGRPDGAGVAEGCTTWAAAGAATANGAPLLAKNRDYELQHLPLQMVVRATPETGYRYTFVTSAGSPGVFVAGCNEAGLAVADTHVSSSDVGPGLPMCALSMHILEEQETVRGALAYLQATPRLGRNNLLLADASGDIACFEAGHAAYGICAAENGMLVNTNHFNSPAMAGAFVDTEIAPLRGNSQLRYRRVSDLLAGQSGKIDLAWGERLLQSHDGPPGSICRHAFAGASTATIASILFLPAERKMVFHHGQPCAPAAPPAVFQYG
jgi:isopenicillin-N N-acyltransferase like protein